MSTFPIKMKRSEVLGRIITTSDPAEHGMDRARAEVLIEALVGVGLLEIEPEPVTIAGFRTDDARYEVRRWPGGGDYGRGKRYELVQWEAEHDPLPTLLWSSDKPKSPFGGTSLRLRLLHSLSLAPCSTAELMRLHSAYSRKDIVDTLGRADHAGEIAGHVMNETEITWTITDKGRSILPEKWVEPS